MKLALSVRVAEKATDKRTSALPLVTLAGIAGANGYRALCMRASQVGIHTPATDVAAAAALLHERGLRVAMVTGDYAIAENSDEAPAALRNMGPYLDLAGALGCDLVRVAIKREEDFAWARRAADAARERGVRLAQQCHTRSPFERVDAALAALRSVGRENFGLIYEAANLELCGEPHGPEAIARLAPHILNVYVQNQRVHANGAIAARTQSRGPVRYDPIALDAGDGLDFPAIFGELAAVGYAGYVTVHQPDGDAPEKTAADSARYLRGLAHFH